MAKCIVCNRSAGPFYSLHKACYKIYEDTRKCIHRVYSNSIKLSIQEDKFKQTIDECKPSSSFSQDLFISLLKREWQDQALQIVKSKSLNCTHADYLLSVAAYLGIDGKEVEPHLFSRLANIKYLAKLNQNENISYLAKEVHDELEMLVDESIIWVFEETVKEKQQKEAEEKQWSVFYAVVNNLFNKSRYKELEVKVEGTGKFVITNRSIYYLDGKDVTKIDFADIYSLTPLKDGIRIQSTQRDTMPNTYITGDGRFTYALLRYATEQNI